MIFLPLLEDNERYRLMVDPRLALDTIIILVFKYGYSIHADVKVDEDKDKEIKNVIQLTIKKKDKRTIHISKRAKMLIQHYLY